MSTEPERDIEKQLKAYADQRKQKAGKPLQMPGHTRALLEREVARLAAGRRTQGGFFRIFANWKFQSAFAAIVIVAVGVFLLRTPHHNGKMQLASDNKSATPAFLLKDSTNRGSFAQAPVPAPPLGSVVDKAMDSLKLGPELAARAPASMPANIPGSMPPDTVNAPASAAIDRPARREMALAPPAVAAPPAPAERDLATAQFKDLNSQTAIATDRTLAPTDSLRSRSATVSVPVVTKSPATTTLAAAAKAETVASAGAAAGGGFGGTNGAMIGRAGGGAPPAPAPVTPANGAVISSTPPAAADYGFRANSSLTIAPSAAAEPAPILGVSLKEGSPPEPEPVNVTGFTTTSMAEGSAAQDFAQLPATVTASRSQNSQKPSDARSSQLSAKVLQSFRMEKTGEQLRVIDADGSVYTGAISRRDSPGANNLELAKKTLRRDKTDAAPGNPVYYFRAEGTNLTVNAFVRFTGDLIPAGEPTVVRTKTAMAPASMQRVGVFPTSTPLAGAGLYGRAWVGNATEVPINAFPVGK